ncbi:MAG: isocitrate/isopropylmalate family dehydrogenase, partial [Methanosarcinales archaeon]
MMDVRVAVIEGDGVGREVVPVAVDLLKHLEPEFEFVPVEVGYGKWRRVGVAVDDDLELMKGCDCALFGAVTTPPDPRYRSVLVRLRREFDLYANIRPYRYMGVHIPQYRPLKPF